MSVPATRRRRAGSIGSSVSGTTSEQGTSAGRVAASGASSGAGAGAGAGASDGNSARVDDKMYMQWKANVPLLYDWLQHYNFEWPSLSFCWGQVLDGGETATSTTQRFFMSTRTSECDWRGSVSCLLGAQAHPVPGRVLRGRCVHA